MYKRGANLRRDDNPGLVLTVIVVMTVGVADKTAWMGVNLLYGNPADGARVRNSIAADSVCARYRMMWMVTVEAGQFGEKGRRWRQG